MTEPPIDEESASDSKDDLLDVALAAAFGPGSPIVPEGGFPGRAPEQRTVASPWIHLHDPEDLSRPLEDSSDFQPHKLGKVGRCEILAQVGQGGMGEVFRGRDENLGRQLAVKILSASHIGKPALVRRFLEEAQIGGQLQHPGVVPIHEVGRLADGRPFFTMKLVKGQTLAALLAARSDPAQDLPRLLSVFEQVCQTLAYAHACGVIHRDLKPANIMVGAFGEVQVMDWGLAKVLRRNGSPVQTGQEHDGQAIPRIAGLAASQTGAVLGTLAYMAPEQARGEVRNLDERCDVFGLGGILCEILTGTPPYHGATREELLPQAAEGDVRGAQARLEASPADKDLVGLAHRCLATEPQDRPRDAGVVSREITAYLASVQNRLRAAELERARALAKAVAERTTRRLTVGLAASLLAMVLLAGGVGWWYVSEQAKTERQVNESLDEAVRLWGQAREAPVGELSKWSEVRAAVRQAEALLAERVGNEQARKRIQDLVADLETEESLARGRAEEAKRDQEMIERLAEIRLRRSEVSQGHFDFEGADAAYASRFREYGIDVDNIDDAQATALIRAPAIRLRLAAALDDWASARRSIKDMPNASWQRLIKIARQADSDDFRTSLRTSLEQEDLKTLKELAARANIKALPAATLDLLGKSLFLAGDANSAIAVLQSAQREHPDDFWINHNLAKLFGKTKPPRPDQQVRYYSVAAALSSQSPGVYNNLGVALTHLGAPAEAAAAYRRAIDLQPEMAEAHSNLGDALASQGKTAEAIGELREAIRLKSNYFEAHFNLANVLTQGQRFEEAVSEYAKALQIQPNAALAQSNLGIALVRQGKTDEAIAAFRKAIKMDPAYPQAYCNLGSALSDNGANEEAIPKLQEAIRLKPDYTFAHLNLGTALWRTGKLDEAATSFRAASRLKPEHYVCHYYLGCVLMEKGLLDEALVPLRETLRYNPGNTNALMRIGEVQYRKGIFDEAIATFREIIRGDPNLAEAHCRLGQALKDKGQFADAVTEMKQAHELGSKDPKWPFPSGQWLKSYEGLAALDRKLSSHLKAEVKIDKVADQIELAEFCLKDKRSFATAALLFEKALLANPGLQDDDGSIRTNACRSALLAADGKSTDAANLSDPERRHWRTQAIAWLREDLDKCKKLKESGIAKDRDAIRSKLQNWQALPELKSMREKLFLAELSESDRKTCLDLWQEVDGLLSE